MIIVKQNSPNPAVLGAKNVSKWYASRLTGQMYPMDIDIDPYADGEEIVTVSVPEYEYIGPNGWQKFAHYFDTSEECAAALARFGISDVEIKPYVPRKSIRGMLTVTGQ